MGTPATRFEDLGVWPKAHPFVRKVDRLTRTFPRSEIYGRSSRKWCRPRDPRGVGMRYAAEHAAGSVTRPTMEMV